MTKRGGGHEHKDKNRAETRHQHGSFGRLKNTLKKLKFWSRFWTKDRRDPK